jgi:hypothetical protein
MISRVVIISNGGHLLFQFSNWPENRDDAIISTVQVLNQFSKEIDHGKISYVRFKDSADHKPHSRSKHSSVSGLTSGFHFRSPSKPNKKDPVDLILLQEKNEYVTVCVFLNEMTFIANEKIHISAKQLISDIFAKLDEHKQVLENLPKLVDDKSLIDKAAIESLRKSLTPAIDLLLRNNIKNSI